MNVPHFKRVCVIVYKNAKATPSQKIHFKSDGLIEVVRVPYTAMPRSVFDILPDPLLMARKPAWTKSFSSLKKHRYNMYQLRSATKHEEIVLCIPRVMSQMVSARRRVRIQCTPRLLPFKINHNGNQVILATLSVAKIPNNDPMNTSQGQHEVTVFTWATLNRNLHSVEPYIVPEPMIAAKAIAYEAEAQIAPIVRQLNPNALKM